MKKLIYILFCLFFIFPGQAFAGTSVARSSARLSNTNIVPEDKRAETLAKFLSEHNSPMAPYAKTFIEEADKNNIDWKLVAAISGNESQFGLLIPPFSNNAWGYGLYGNNVRNFYSWDDGITTVSKAIRDDYLDKWGATNIYEIGAIYAEDPLWASKVSYYLSLIQNYESRSISSISISF